MCWHQWKMKQCAGMEIIAHRGASYDGPENTLSAARMAWEQGADGIECDVHLTSDGHLVVIHDDDTARVAAARHVVSETTLALLRTLDVGRWKNPRFSGEQIPTLDEMLSTVTPGRKIFLELKSGES